VLRQIIPTIDQALELTVEEFAYAVLRTLQPTRTEPIHCGNRFNDLMRAYDGPLHERDPTPESKKKELRVAIAEALAWLEANGLLAKTYDGNYCYFVVTRRGLQIDTIETFRDFLKTTVLRREALHRTLQEEAWPLYIRGKFDLSIFEALKQVEVAVRDAGGFTEDDYGVALMRDAFNKTSGPLTDKSLPQNEREAIAHLFSGAIGAFKNPNSHRVVGLDDAGEAAELLMLASQLLRLVDEAVSRNSATTP
jgi:uncharacterized protein (TIGR02391 family)